MTKEISNNLTKAQPGWVPPANNEGSKEKSSKKIKLEKAVSEIQVAQQAEGTSVAAENIHLHRIALAQTELEKGLGALLAIYTNNETNPVEGSSIEKLYSTLKNDREANLLIFKKIIQDTLENTGPGSIKGLVDRVITKMDINNLPET